MLLTFGIETSKISVKTKKYEKYNSYNKSVKTRLTKRHGSRDGNVFRTWIFGEVLGGQEIPETDASHHTFLALPQTFFKSIFLLLSLRKFLGRLLIQSKTDHFPYQNANFTTPERPTDSHKFWSTFFLITHTPSESSRVKGKSSSAWCDLVPSSI